MNCMAPPALASRQRALIATKASALLAFLAAVVSWPGAPAQAQGGPPAFSVVVSNPVTLNPNSPNPVTITNPPGAPPSTVNVGNPAELAGAIAKAQAVVQPFRAQTHCNPQVLNVSRNCRNDDVITPGNARVILEYVGVRCTALAGAVAAFAQIIDDSGAFFYPVTVTAAPTPNDSGGFGEITFSQAVRLYFDPGSTIGIMLGFGGGGLNNCSVTFSGQQIAQ
jgi:hypothetical protein